MQLSSASRALLESPAVEGCVLHAYKDQGGYLTIGVGHLLSEAEKRRGTIILEGKPVAWTNGLTADQADRLCRQDVEWAERDVEQHVAVPLVQHQFDALVIFVFNVGPEQFGGSHLLHLLNAGLYDSVPAQLARWIYVKKKKSTGLQRRRAIESSLWKGP